MKTQHHICHTLAWVFGFVLAANIQSSFAAADAGVEVLTRGPIHEAFLEQANYDPVPGVLVERVPPAAIQELPPEHKPADERVIWIPGYWAWDDDANDFMWLSGVWRVPPPNCRWVPGYWNQRDEGYQWISGFWLTVETKQVQYYQQPPASLERGSTSPAPSANHFWLAGHWTYDDGQYKWRAGTWVPGQAGWTWTPDRYIYTPRGYLHAKGHWDHKLEARGVLFAPIRLADAANTGANWSYSPAYVIPHQQLFLHLFARSSTNHYYFGDYYGDQYAGRGFATWFAVDAKHRGHDPLFDYYAWDHRRGGTDYLNQLTRWNKYFVTHPEFRPPTTLANQREFVASRADFAYREQAVVSASLADYMARLGASAFTNLTMRQRVQWRELGLEATAIAAQRLDMEGLASIAGAVPNVARPVLELPAVSPRLAAVGGGVLNQGPAEPRKLLNTAPVLRQVEQSLTPDQPLKPLRRVPAALPKLPF